MKSTDLIIGEYYHITYRPTGAYLIIKNEGPSIDNGTIDTYRIQGTFISNMNSIPKFEFRIEKNVYIGEDRIVRVATWEERKWLEACIDYNKLIPKDRVKLEPNYEIF